MRTRPGRQPEAKSFAPACGRRAVFLIGFMGAGKSSVGRALSRQLGWPFEDLDERIQAREGLSIEQIFQQSGEIEFRRAEHAALRALLSELGISSRVVALGGGTFVQRHNTVLLEEPGMSVIFLDAPVEELFRRCHQEQVERPLRGDLEQFRQLYEARRPHYATAKLRIETAGKDIETIAAEITTSLGLSKAGSQGAAK
jgi:shikimate kinase